MRRIFQLFVFVAPLLSHSTDVPDWLPFWFPLGTTFAICNPGVTSNTLRDTEIAADVYQEKDCLTVQSNVLQVVQSPRWFGGHHIPAALNDVPLTNQGASLTFEIRRGRSPNILEFDLTLTAGQRKVWREMEHRKTNIFPFLFNFVADGKQARPIKELESGGIGGVEWMTELAPAGTSTTWRISVDAVSIGRSLKLESAKSLVVVAAFSEYQHVRWMGASEKFPCDPQFAEGFKGPPIVLRSNSVRLLHDGKKWTPGDLR